MVRLYHYVGGVLRRRKSLLVVKRMLTSAPESAHHDGPSALLDSSKTEVSIPGHNDVIDGPCQSVPRFHLLEAE